jgi:hypothetical protein
VVPVSRVPCAQFVVFFCERMCQMGQGFVVIFDMSGWKLSHALQLRKVNALVSTLQDHYPERLIAAKLLRTPGIFSAAWKAIRPWLDPVTAAKVSFISSKAEKDAFTSAGVPESLIPQTYGGTLDPAAIPVPNLPGEPAVSVTAS